jgi:hypothetical protein
MSRAPRRQRDEIRRILADAGWVAVDGASVDGVVARLQAGAGEEALVQHLRVARPEWASVEAARLVPVARDLFRVGVRPGGGGWRRRSLGPDVCTICDREVPFCWSCPCGFRICQACMDENRWGLTCNNVTWECPECGGFRSY